MTKGLLKACLLGAMIASFFISNGITGGLGAVSNCKSGGLGCSDNGCNGSDGQGGNWCCVDIGGCQCVDTTSSQCP